MHRLLTVLCISVAFCLGYWLALGRQSSMSDVLLFTDVERLRHEVLALQALQEEKSSLEVEGQQGAEQVGPGKLQALLSDVQKLTSDQFSALVYRLPDYEIDRQLGRLFRESDFSDHIFDKRAFAARLAEEAVKEPDPAAPLSGLAAISVFSEFPDFSLDVFEVQPRQTLFAHFDTYGEVPTNGQVFIRWRHRDTGELLLFTRKNITADATRHWVSYRPESAWKTGYYDVTYYQFSDSLEPIAQVGYLISGLQGQGAAR